MFYCYVCLFCLSNQCFVLFRLNDKTYLSRIVDICVSLEQQGRDVLVSVVGCDVEGGEARLGGDVGVVVAGLKEKAGGLRVVLLGRDVQGRKSDLAAGVVFEQDRDNLWKIRVWKFENWDLFGYL